MTRKEQIKIFNDKIKANNAQYNIDRLNAKISAFSEGNLDKYEFLTRKDLKYKPNALDKPKFEFFPLGKAFNQGLDKNIQGYQEEGVIKLLKDIRDGLAGGVNSRNGRNGEDFGGDGGRDSGGDGGRNGRNGGRNGGDDGGGDGGGGDGGGDGGGGDGDGDDRNNIENRDNIDGGHDLYGDMPDLETEREATERIADHSERRKKIVTDNSDDENGSNNERDNKRQK